MTNTRKDRILLFSKRYFALCTKYNLWKILLTLDARDFCRISQFHAFSFSLFKQEFLIFIQRLFLLHLDRCRFKQTLRTECVHIDNISVRYFFVNTVYRLLMAITFLHFGFNKSFLARRDDFLYKKWATRTVLLYFTNLKYCNKIIVWSFWNTLYKLMAMVTIPYTGVYQLRQVGTWE